MPAFIVVTGLPASGKTTVARALASELALLHLDKDTFLEALFCPESPPSLEQRSILSRKADALFQTAATRAGTAVLSSWWRHPESDWASGTSTEWLQHRDVTLLEIYCHCPVSVAVQRFFGRQRHPNHADSMRNPSELLLQFQEAAALGPLFPERALWHDTAEPISASRLQVLAQQVRQRAGANSEA